MDNNNLIAENKKLNLELVKTNSIDGEIENEENESIEEKNEHGINDIIENSVEEKKDEVK